MTEVPLTQGQVALVDDEDADRILVHRWFAMWDPSTRSYRAARKIRREVVYLSTFIIGQPGDVQIDHANHNTLDDQRQNLRVATGSQNSANRRRRSDNTTGFIGVYWRAERKKWSAMIRVNGVLKHLGYFDLPEEAAQKRDEAAYSEFGEFATLNFPKET